MHVRWYISVWSTSLADALATAVKGTGANRGFCCPPTVVLMLCNACQGRPQGMATAMPCAGIKFELWLKVCPTSQIKNFELWLEISPASQMKEHTQLTTAISFSWVCYRELFSQNGDLTAIKQNKQLLSPQDAETEDLLKLVCLSNKRGMMLFISAHSRNKFACPNQDFVIFYWSSCVWRRMVSSLLDSRISFALKLDACSNDVMLFRPQRIAVAQGCCWSLSPISTPPSIVYEIRMLISSNT